MKKKRIVALSGSPRKKDSYKITNQLIEEMQKLGEVELDYINLNNLNIHNCLGCMQCFDKGEHYCPFDDDVQMVKEKLINSNGIIFISPVYALQITGKMKMVIDRLSYMFHRPELIAKPAITIVTTKGGGIKPTEKYLSNIAQWFGCNVVGNLSVMSTFYFENSPYYYSKYHKSTFNKIIKLADCFYKEIDNKTYPTPSFSDIYTFQGLKSKTYLSSADYDYWSEHGWLDSNYYYPTKLNPLKWLFGKSLSFLIRIISKSYLKEQRSQG